MGSQKLLPGYIEVKECTKPALHAMLAGDGQHWLEMWSGRWESKIPLWIQYSFELKVL
jgi:hypothetical protein